MNNWILSKGSISLMVALIFLSTVYWTQISMYNGQRLSFSPQHLQEQVPQYYEGQDNFLEDNRGQELILHDRGILFFFS